MKTEPRHLFFKEFCKKGGNICLSREDAAEIWRWITKYKSQEVAKAKVDMIRWVKANALGFIESKQKLIIKNKLEVLRKRV